MRLPAVSPLICATNGRQSARDGAAVYFYLQFAGCDDLEAERPLAD